MRASLSLRLPLVALLLSCATPERSPAPERAREASAGPPPAAAAAVPATAPAQPPAEPKVTAAAVAPDEVTRADRARVDQLAQKAEPLVDAFLNSDALLTRDGRQVVLVSNRDGLPQLYVADAARPESSARRKLPVIVSYHGGPASSSRIRWSAITAFFLSEGYAWVEPNVRGSGGFGRAFEETDPRGSRPSRTSSGPAAGPPRSRGRIPSG